MMLSVIRETAMLECVEEKLRVKYVLNMKSVM
jgi:hypothetical protein